MTARNLRPADRVRHASAVAEHPISCLYDRRTRVLGAVASLGARAMGYDGRSADQLTRRLEPSGSEQAALQLSPQGASGIAPGRG